jgi:LacI family transcriptional regulator
VINRHPEVDPALRRRVQIASRQIGFIPRLQHRHIALITSHRSPDLPLVNYAGVMTSLISQYLAASGYAVELIEVGNLDLLYEAQTRGAIGLVFDDSLVEALKIPNLPLLTINHPMTDRRVHSVRADHYRQGLLAAEHFLRRGHRKLGFLAGRLTEWGSSERLRGYKTAMAAAGIDVETAFVQSTQGRRVYNILSRWAGQGVTGILNFSDDVAFEVLHILSNILKLRIGSDISVISLEDMELYQFLTPPHTTVSQPLNELARIAVTTMLELCESPSADNDIVDICLPTHLIERDSVVTLPG